MKTKPKTTGTAKTSESVELYMNKMELIKKVNSSSI